METSTPMVLAMAWELRFFEVYRMGGAQALAALALGTDSIPVVDKIVGPGKRLCGRSQEAVVRQGRY